MISVEELATQIDPENTTLFLGAGACKGSGAPLASELEEELRKRLDPGLPPSDLATTSAILEKRKGRGALIAAVRDVLEPLRADDNLVSLALYDWKCIYTTNYDTLVENAFHVQQRPLSVIRNNRDFSDNLRSTTVVEYFKLHGCISADVVDRDSSSRLVLTESDYDRCADYRECLLSAFGAHVGRGSTVICGHSLRDRHLTDILRKAIEVHRGTSENHQIYLLGRPEEQEFIEIQEGRGFIGCAASLAQFVVSLRKRLSGRRKPIERAGSGFELTGKLKRSVRPVQDDLSKEVRDRKFFAGFTPTVSQINAGLTFPRSLAALIARQIDKASHQFIVVTGPSGSGKRTVGRQVCLGLHRCSMLVWELEELATVDVSAWLSVARALDDMNVRGLLFIPDCAAQLQNINSLISSLLNGSLTSLSILVTADSTQWTHRIKSRGFATNGTTHSATHLTADDIGHISKSYLTNPAIEPHINPVLIGASEVERVRILTSECHGDVVVALSKLFRGRYIEREVVDEFRRLKTLDESAGQRVSEIYGVVSAIEAAGSVAERQLVHRITGFSLTEIAAILHSLDETVMESDMPTGVGAYIWHTRHPVIAKMVADYNLRSPADWRALIRRIAAAVNPAIQHELSIFRRLLSSHLHLGSKNERIGLFDELLQKFPGERFIWHRLISTYRAEGTIAECRHAIEEAKRIVGIDPPLARYELLMLKDEALNRTSSDSDKDQISKLRSALERAVKLIERFPDDKYMYDSYAQIACELLKRGEREPSREDVLSFLSRARKDLLDPDFDKVVAPTISKLRSL